MSGPFTTITVDQFHRMQDKIAAADRLAVVLTATFNANLIPAEGLGVRLKEALNEYSDKPND